MRRLPAGKFLFSRWQIVSLVCSRYIYACSLAWSAATSPMTALLKLTHRNNSYLLSRLLGGKHLTQEIKICHISEKKQPYLYSGTYSFGSDRFLNKTQRLYAKTPGASAAKGVPASAKQYIFPDCVFALSLPAGTAVPFSRNV